MGTGWYDWADSGFYIAREFDRDSRGSHSRGIGAGELVYRKNGGFERFVHLVDLYCIYDRAFTGTSRALVFRDRDCSYLSRLRFGIILAVATVP